MLADILIGPYYEENDDNALSNIVSGAYGEVSSRMVFTNIILGKILSILISTLPMVKWYVLILYLIIFSSFCVLTYVLKKKCGQFGLYVNVILLTFFGYECYIAVQLNILVR